MWWLSTGCTNTKRVKYLRLKNFCFIFQPYINKFLVEFKVYVQLSSQFYFDYCENLTLDNYHVWTQKEFCYWIEMCKVEKILKGRLDSIPSPSPSMKIQIMGGKACLRCKAKHCWVLSTSLWKQKVCWHHPAVFCLILHQANFPAHNFHWRWRWWDRIQATIYNLFCFKIW